MCKHINQTGDQRAKSADLRKKLQVWSWQIWKKSLVINLGKLVLCSRDDIDVWGPWGPLAGTSEGPKIWRIKGPKKLECLFGGKVLLLGTVKSGGGNCPTGPPGSVGPGALDHHLHRARAKGEAGKIPVSTKLWNFKLTSQWFNFFNSIKKVISCLRFFDFPFDKK